MRTPDPGLRHDCEMTILPRGPVPASVPFAIAVTIVMAFAFAIGAASLIGLLVASLAVWAYAYFTWRAGTSGGSDD